MKCLTKSAVVICFAIILNIVCGAPSGGGFTAYDDEDKVRSHVIDPNSNDSDFGAPLYTANDDVISEVLNINDSNASSVLNRFNVTMDYILSRMSNFSGSTAASTVGRWVDDNQENGKKGQFLDMFKQRIKSAVDKNSSKPSLESAAVTNFIAFYPVCSKNDENSWLADNTAKLYFSSTMFSKLNPNTYFHKAELRLLQKNPDQELSTTPLGCAELDDIITVTVSVMVKRNIKGELKLKKRVCNSFTISKRHTGWVAVDIEQVIRQWEKAYRTNRNNTRAPISDPMLMIDVEDQDKNQLKAGTFFEPTDCQASTPIPWSFYQHDVWNITPTFDLPPYPRIDIKWSYLETSLYPNTRKNRLDSFRLLPGSPIFGRPDPYNFRYLSGEQKTHRKRHLQNKHIHHRHHSTEASTN